MKYCFIPYNSSFKKEIEGRLISKKLLRKYTSKRIIFRLGAFFDIYKNYFFLLKDLESNCILGTVLLRKKIDPYKFKKNWWIYGVFIISEYRGKGLSSTLLDYAIEELKKRKVNKVSLFVDKYNLNAIKLYKRYGFTVERKVKKFKKKNGNFITQLKMIYLPKLSDSFD